MKNIIKILISLLMVLLLAVGCDKEEKTEKLKVIVTNFPAYDFARAVAGDIAEIEMLLQPGADSHTYDPTPKDIINISNADIFIYTGGETDTVISKMIAGIDSDVKIIKLMEHASLVEKPLIRANESRYDEHVWTSPKNSIELIKAIKDVFIQIDSENANNYSSNAEAYITELKKLDEDFVTTINTASRKEIIFGDKFPFIYFTTEYGLDYSAAYPGCAVQIEPSIGVITHLINRVKEQKIPVVFYLENSDKKIAENISSQTGAKLLMFHSTHNVSEAEFNKGATYLSLMKENLINLKEALN